jgi:hypothetical protein
VKAKTDPKSGHPPATAFLRPKPCQQSRSAHSELFAFLCSYTWVGRETLRRLIAISDFKPEKLQEFHARVVVRVPSTDEMEVVRAEKRMLRLKSKLGDPVATPSRFWGSLSTDVVKPFSGGVCQCFLPPRVLLFAVSPWIWLTCFWRDGRPPLWRPSGLGRGPSKPRSICRLVWRRQ